MQESETFQLVMEKGPRPGQVFELPRSTVSIGRDPGNQVIIKDSQVSRQHARITPQGGLMVVEDLGSTNGTRVNGLRITGPHTLAHRDEISLGDNVSLIFYGQPSDSAGQTIVGPRPAYTGPPPSTFPPSRSPRPSAYEPDPESAYEQGPGVAFPSSEAGYDEADASDYAYYEDYPKETGRNWTLISLGCILIAIILILLVAILVYFFAPASIVDPIADFLAGLGISVP